MSLRVETEVDATCLSFPPAGYYVFDSCYITSTSSSTGTSVYLGRPWGAYARVVFQYSSLGAHINPAHWSVWRCFPSLFSSKHSFATSSAKFTSCLLSPSSSDTRTGHVTFGESRPLRLSFLNPQSCFFASLTLASSSPPSLSSNQVNTQTLEPERLPPVSLASRRS